MKNAQSIMTEKMPTTKPPTRSTAVSRVSSQGASALIHERSITVLHPDAHVFLGESDRERYDFPKEQLSPIRISRFMEYRRDDVGPYSALMLAVRITFAHLCVSSATNFPKSEGESIRGPMPRS